jgi:hypothetical protein
LSGAAPADTSIVRVFVEGIQIMVDTTRMTAPQALETASEKVEGKVENIGYLHFQTTEATHSGQITVNSQTDVQSVCLVYRANDVVGAVPGSTGRVQNPLQLDNGNITSLSVAYGSDSPLK